MGGVAGAVAGGAQAKAPAAQVGRRVVPGAYDSEAEGDAEARGAVAAAAAREAAEVRCEGCAELGHALQDCPHVNSSDQDEEEEEEEDDTDGVNSGEDY